MRGLLTIFQIAVVFVIVCMFGMWLAPPEKGHTSNPAPQMVQGSDEERGVVVPQITNTVTQPVRTVTVLHTVTAPPAPGGSSIDPKGHTKTTNGSPKGLPVGSGGTVTNTGDPGAP